MNFIYTSNKHLSWILLFLSIGCSNEVNQFPMQFHGSTMGSTYTVKILMLPDTITQQQLEVQIAAILGRLHAQMSTYDANSEVSRFNSNRNTDWFSVSTDVCRIVELSQQISQLSNGAFDITVSPLVNLWGFGPAPTRTAPPSAAEIQIAKQRVGYQHLQTRCNDIGLTPALRKNYPHIAIDLSAIAQGYGADKIADYLDLLGIADYLVDVGGELRSSGVNAQKMAWRIGVERPISSQQGQVEQVLPIKDCAVATSGSYRNFFEANGKRYSHTIDPNTGSPVTHNLVSVTIVTKIAAVADAWATAISVLGAEKGYAVAKKNNLAVLLIEQKGDKFLETQTPQLTSYLGI